MNTQKKAREDAHEYARAAMFFGEGAGIRRKLIEASVEARCDRDPEYARAFNQALRKEDMADHAKKARKEREQLDRNTSISKNVRGILTGNNQSVNTGVLVVSAIAYYAHQTGVDQKIWDASKRKYRDVKNRIRVWRNKDAVQNITTI